MSPDPVLLSFDFLSFCFILDRDFVSVALSCSTFARKPILSHVLYYASISLDLLIDLRIRQLDDEFEDFTSQLSTTMLSCRKCPVALSSSALAILMHHSRKTSNP
jgi:hypothetical protein